MWSRCACMDHIHDFTCLLYHHTDRWTVADDNMCECRWQMTTVHGAADNSSSCDNAAPLCVRCLRFAPQMIGQWVILRWYICLWITDGFRLQQMSAMIPCFYYTVWVMLQQPWDIIINPRKFPPKNHNYILKQFRTIFVLIRWNYQCAYYYWYRWELLWVSRAKKKLSWSFCGKSF